MMKTSTQRQEHPKSFLNKRIRQVTLVVSLLFLALGLDAQTITSKTTGGNWNNTGT